MHLQNIKQNKTTFCRETTTFVGNEARFVVLFADGILSCIQLLGQWIYKKELNEKNYCSIPVTRPLLFLFWTSWFRWCPLCNGFKGHWNVSRFMPKWPLILTSRAFLPEKLPIKQQTLIRSNKQNKKNFHGCPGSTSTTPDSAGPEGGQGLGQGLGWPTCVRKTLEHRVPQHSQLRRMGCEVRTKTKTPEQEKSKLCPPRIRPSLTPGKAHHSEIQLTFMFVWFFLPGDV